MRALARTGATDNDAVVNNTTRSSTETLPKLSQGENFAYGWAHDYGNCLSLSSPQLQSSTAAMVPTR